MTMFDRDIERFFKVMSHPFFKVGEARTVADDVFEELRADDSVTGPLYYGYTMTVGPDGRPVVKEYGNIRPNRRGTAADATLPDAPRKPAVETIVDEKEKTVKLIAEMPGVEKTDVRLLVDNKTVDIAAERGTKKYHTRVPVKQTIDGESGQASYKNGILQVVFKQLDEKPAGRIVEVR